MKTKLQVAEALMLLSTKLAASDPETAVVLQETAQLADASHRNEGILAQLIISGFSAMGVILPPELVQEARDAFDLELADRWRPPSIEVADVLVKSETAFASWDEMEEAMRSQKYVPTLRRQTSESMQLRQLVKDAGYQVHPEFLCGT